MYGDGNERMQVRRLSGCRRRLSVAMASAVLLGQLDATSSELSSQTQRRRSMRGRSSATPAKLATNHRRTATGSSIGGTMIQMGEWGSCQPVGQNCLKFRAVLCLDSTLTVVESSNCEGIDALPTYEDCEPSECGQDSPAPTPTSYSYDYTDDGHDDGGGSGSGSGSGGGGGDHGSGNNGNGGAGTNTPVTSAPTRRPTPAPTKQPTKPTHSGSNRHKHHDDDGGARFNDDRVVAVPTTPSPTAKDDWLSTVTGGGGSSSKSGSGSGGSGWKGSTGGGMSSKTTTNTYTTSTSHREGVRRTGGGMTAIMTFLGIILSAITAFVGFHYYKRLNPSHCVDKIRYSKVPTQMDEFDEDANFEFPEDRINPFEFHNESGEGDEKAASNGMHYTQSQSTAGTDAVELQPMRATGSSSPSAVKGD